MNTRKSRGQLFRVSGHVRDVSCLVDTDATNFPRCTISFSAEQMRARNSSHVLTSTRLDERSPVFYCIRVALSLSLVGGLTRQKEEE